MATVVYDGVGRGGTLFKGMKFFLMQRLPTRDRWKELITSNGGEVVQIEKQADLIIADHARKFTPAGSISWKFIEQSVTKGELEDLADHRAGPTVGTIREVGSAQPMRRGKTPFTAEDDRILMEWCTIAERKGLLMQGNDLYKQLEEKNNRHTFQSWRDRWIKHLSGRPRPTLSEEREPSAHGSPKFRPPENRRHLPKTATAAQITLASSSKIIAPQSGNVTERKRAQSSSPILSSAVKPSAGNHFTDEDTELLEGAYKDLLNLSDDQVIDAWLTWAENYPNHTAQEWRNYFKEYVVPKKLAGKEAKKISPPALNRPKAAPAASSPKNKSAKFKQIQDLQDSSLQARQSGRKTRNNPDPRTVDEKIFIEDLSTLAETLDLETDFRPEICGRKIPLFKLWQVVQSEEFGGWDRVEGKKLWPKVARLLNFNDFQQPNAAQELRHCYNEILADFEECRRDWEEAQCLSESQERAMLEAQLLETAAFETQNLNEKDEGEEYDDDELVEEEEDDDLDRPQFSPHSQIPSSSSKRSFGADRTNVDTSYNKRQRIEKGKDKKLEIPSTPEDDINNNQTARPSLKPSPLKFPSPVHHQEEDEDSSDIETLFVKPLQPRPKRKHQPQNLEPETQDFHYPRTQAVLEKADGDIFVNTPSSPPRHKQPDRSSGSNATNRGSGPFSNPTGSSTQSQTESERAADMEKYFHHCISLGYSQEAVALALEATTMEIGAHTMQVMESLEIEQGIPADIPGVWTVEDDRKVAERLESDAFREMIKKHGLRRCGMRKNFLEDQRLARMEREREGGG